MNPRRFAMLAACALLAACGRDTRTADASPVAASLSALNDLPTPARPGSAEPTNLQSTRLRLTSIGSRRVLSPSCRGLDVQYMYHCAA